MAENYFPHETHWWSPAESDSGGAVQCRLCPRRCRIEPGRRGFCFVRENVDGRLTLSTYGRSTGFCIDPIEKKPLNQFYPGTAVLSFGTAGCNLGCKFCQNWTSSRNRQVDFATERALPEAIAAAAKTYGCRSVAYTYNDPIIWAEYAIDTARVCRREGIKNVAVTSGYISAEARAEFYADMDAANVDLKAFSDDFYRRLCQGALQPVLDTLVYLARETEVWVEITNLVIPGENDSPDELKQMADWIVENLGDEVPLHFSAFHPDYKLNDRPPTPLKTLQEAWKIAHAAGIKYIYTGNVRDEARQSTYCPHCGEVLIRRSGYELSVYKINDRNQCDYCGVPIAGRFDPRPGTWGSRRQPIRISDFASVAPPPAAEPTEKKETDMNQENHSDAHATGAPQLTAEQEAAVLQSACRTVAASVLGLENPPGDKTLAGAASQPVLGSFVTLRRKGQLRACCGFFGQKSTVGEAISYAAVQTATNDSRFPPISAGELPYLHVDVWLLHEPRQVTARGEDRVAEVVIGRHGLQIRRGAYRGLLLPGVAVDHNMDAREFLDAVCHKAGLRAGDWLRDDTQLWTFEGVAIEGPFDQSVLQTEPPAAPPLLSAGQLTALAAFCRNNVFAIQQGATPSYYAPGLPDLTVEGIGIELRFPGEGRPPRFSKISFRPGLPLQSNLFNLAQEAGALLRARGITVAGPGDIQIGLTVLYDSSMHGLLLEPDVQGIDPKHRAVMIHQGDRFAWIYDPSRSAEELLEAVRREAEITRPEAASVYSFAALSTEPSMVVAQVPRPRTGAAVRPPAVAGMFYPGTQKEIDTQLDEFLSEPAPEPRPYAGAMVPHAGWRYSGRIAAEVFRRIALPETVIILCPKHTRGGVDCAVAPHQAWSLPGGNLSSDLELAARLAESVPGMQLDAVAHMQEHAIEVQLPILQRMRPDVRVVGIVVGHCDLRQCDAFAAALAGVMVGMTDPPLLVISTDMNHYAGDAETRRLDALAIAAVERLDPDGLYRVVHDNKISMCGMLPAVVVMKTLKQLGRLNRCERIAYDTSATASGDTARVVGYAGMLFE